MSTAPTAAPSASTVLADPQFHGLPPEEQVKALSKIDSNFAGLPPAEQQRVLAQSRTTPKSNVDTGAVMTAQPPFWSARGLKDFGLTTLEKGMELLPTAGGIVGGIVGAGAGAATGPGAAASAIGGAALGGGAGEATRQLLRRGMGWETPQTSGEAATKIGTEGAIQGASQATGEVAGALLKPAGQYFSRTAARGMEVPLLPSEAGVGGPASKTVEGFLSHALPSQGVMADFRAQQLAKATTAAQDQIAKLSNFSGTSEQAGEALQQGIRNGRQLMKDQVNQAYDTLGKLTSSVYPETAGLKSTAKGLLNEIKGQELLMDPKLLADTKSMLTQIMDAPDKVPFQAMAKSRSDLLAVGRQLDEALPGKRAGMAKLLSGEMDKAMEDAANKSGIPGLAGTVRQTNAMTAEMHRKFEQDLITGMMDSKRPEAVSGMLRKAGLQEVRDLNSVLSPPRQRLLQQQVVQDILNDSMDPATGQLNPQKLAKGIYDLGEDRGKEILGGNYSKVRELADLVGRIKPSSSSGGASLHNWAYLSALPTAGSALVTGHPGAAAMVAGGVGAETVFLRKLAGALTNPARSARVIRNIELGMRGTPYAINGMIKILSDQPERPAAIPPPPQK